MVTDKDVQLANKCHSISRGHEFCTTGNIHTHKMVKAIGQYRKEVTAERDAQIAELVGQLKSLQGSRDNEIAHIEAGKILCEILCLFGQKEAVEAFNNLDKWYA